MGKVVELNNEQTQTILEQSVQLVIGDILSERFELVELLGIGGMGVVYKAFDQLLCIDVALKVIRPDKIDSNKIAYFRREILTARAISHKNVIRIHDFYQHESYHFYTMDFFDGETLSSYIQHQPTIDKKITRSIILQLVEAVDAIHKSNVIHRDIKSSNVLINQHGDCIVTDFGIAIDNWSSEENFLLCGTPSYMAPEVLSKHSYSLASDYYALGCLIYEVVGRKSLFAMSSMVDLIREKLDEKLMTRKVNQLPIDAPVRKLILKLLLVNPNKREFNPLEFQQLVTQHFENSIKWRKIATVFFIVLSITVSFSYLNHELIFPVKTLVEQEPFLEPTRILLMPVLMEKEGALRHSRPLADLIYDELHLTKDTLVIDSQRVEQVLEYFDWKNRRLESYQLRELGDLFDVQLILEPVIHHDERESIMVIKSYAKESGFVKSTSLYRKFFESKSLIKIIYDATDSVAEYFRAKNSSASRIEPADISKKIIDEPLFYKGIESYVMGDYNQAIEILLSINQDAKTVEVAYYLSRCYEKLGQYDTLEQLLESTIHQSFEFNRNGYFLGLLQAQYFEMVGDSKEAIIRYKAILHAWPNDLETLILLANLYTRESQFSDAVALLKRVVKIDENHAEAWYGLAKNSILMGNIKRAIEDYLVRALVIQTRQNNQRGIADITNAFGVAYQRQGRLDEALRYYNQAKLARETNKDYRGLATTLRNIANIKIVQGNRTEASNLLTKALALTKDLGDDTGLSAIYNELGVLAEEDGHYPVALEHYRKSRAISRASNDRFSQSVADANIGYIYLLMNQYDHSETYLGQAKKLLITLDDQAGLVRVQTLLAQLLLTKGDYVESLSLLEKTTQKAKELSLDDDLLALKLQFANYMFYVNNLSGAKSMVDELLLSFEKKQDYRGVNEAALLKAKWLLRTEEKLALRSFLNSISPTIEEFGIKEHQLTFRFFSELVNDTGDFYRVALEMTRILKGEQFLDMALVGFVFEETLDNLNLLEEQTQSHVLSDISPLIPGLPMYFRINCYLSLSLYFNENDDKRSDNYFTLLDQIETQQMTLTQKERFEHLRKKIKHRMNIVD